MNAIAKCEKYFTPVGRILIGAFFVIAGFGKIMDISGTASMIEGVGLPLPTILALLTIVIELGAGGALIVGYKTKYAALILAAFTLLASIFFHGPGSWENPMQQIMFMKNMAIMGGLLFIAAHVGAPCCQTTAPKKEDGHTPPSTPQPAL